MDKFDLRMGATAAIVAMTVAAVLTAPASTQAQVQSPGLFGALSGWYSFPAFETWRQFDTPAGASSKAGVGDGWGGRAYGGYRLAGGWDAALGGQYERTGFGGKSVDAFFNTGRVRARTWLIDGELGHTFAVNGMGLRPFIGVRYLKAQFDVVNPIALGLQKAEVDYSGFGPRAGIDAAYRFAGTRLTLFGGVSGAAILGHIEERAVAFWSCAQCPDKGQIAWNANAQLGLGVALAPKATLAVGYRIDGWWGSNFAVLDKSGGGLGSGSGSTIAHGPFARLAYNIGAPAGRPPAPPAPPAAAPAPAMIGNYIVFFDLDQASLSAQARDTIRQASEAARSGGRQRLNVTGHADRSGSDPHNMALSLRRANAVKDELVRNGVPAAAIVLVARGETAPLVPTPDGVKEPQNRRVEIVLQ